MVSCTAGSFFTIWTTLPLCIPELFHHGKKKFYKSCLSYPQPLEKSHIFKHHFILTTKYSLYGYAIIYWTIVITLDNYIVSRFFFLRLTWTSGWVGECMCVCVCVSVYVSIWFFFISPVSMLRCSFLYFFQVYLQFLIGSLCKRCYKISYDSILTFICV